MLVPTLNTLPLVVLQQLLLLSIAYISLLSLFSFSPITTNVLGDFNLKSGG